MCEIMGMELWYTEQHTENVRFSIKVEKQLHSEQTEFQRIDVLEAKEFGKFFTLRWINDGNGKR